MALIAGCAAPAPRAEAPLDGASADPGAGAVLDVEAWTFGAAEGQIIRTRHYRLYTTERDPVLLSRMPGFLEAALAHYRGAIVALPAPPIRLDTYLMDNRAQWRVLSRRLSPELAEQYDNIPRGGYASGGVGVFYDLGVYDTMAIAAHEGWHQYMQRTFREPLPVWLDEGLASYMEGHRWAGGTPVFLAWANVERFDRLRADVSAGVTVPLDRLLDMRPADELGSTTGSALTYYAQVWALVHFLREGEGGRYRDGLRDLVADAAEGRLSRRLLLRLGSEGADRRSMRIGPSVFHAYFGDDLDAIGREYDAFLREIVVPGARDAIVTGRSPLAMGEAP
ncbi:MAG: DUF1570 domain-containing protein [Phycisphaerales bacterium]